MDAVFKSYRETLQKIGASELLQSPTDDARELYLAGVVPWREKAGAVEVYLMRPLARKPHLPPPELQIAKGTRMVIREGAWQDLHPQDMPLSQESMERAEPLAITALREAEEELGLHLSNITDIVSAGRHSFRSATGGKAKEMMLYLATLRDPGNFRAPDSLHGKSSECRWVSLKEEAASIREDHRKVLYRLFEKATE